MNSPMENNRRHWNDLVPIHVKSASYDVDGFKKGRCSLEPIELKVLGDVRGKSLLHLQCHFGLDTLSWARLGAQVTGLDFSQPAIDVARSLSEELNIPARFVCCNLYDAPQHLTEQFDIVFTSYGVLCWLPDIWAWGRTAARFVKPGGTFYIAEFHPTLYIFDEKRPSGDFKVRYPYFQGQTPLEFEDTGTYADRAAPIKTHTFEWIHSLSDTITALIKGGLTVHDVQEFPYCAFDFFPDMVKSPHDGYWRMPNGDGMLPMMFSIQATAV